jgi:hypothetical protein
MGIPSTYICRALRQPQRRDSEPAAITGLRAKAGEASGHYSRALFRCRRLTQAKFLRALNRKFAICGCLFLELKLDLGVQFLRGHAFELQRVFEILSHHFHGRTVSGRCRVPGEFSRGLAGITSSAMQRSWPGHSGHRARRARSPRTKNFSLFPAATSPCQFLQMRAN